VWWTVFSDQYWLWIFEIFLLGLASWAVLMDLREKLRIWREQRTEEVVVALKPSRANNQGRRFHLVYGFISVIAVQLVSSSEAGKGYRVFVILLDLAALMYLAYFNRWFQTRVARLVSWWEQS